MSTVLQTDPPQRSPSPTSDVALQQPGLSRGASWYALVVSVAIAAGLTRLIGWNLGILAVLSVVLYLIGIYAVSRWIEGSRKATDRLVTGLVTSAFLVALLPLVTVVWTILSEGLGVLSSGFFTASMRNVVGEGGGIYHAIWGTIIITLLATVISVPIGLFAAIYLVEYGRGRLAKQITFLVDVMTGIPSIVAGLFAYALFEIFFGAGVRLGVGGAVALSLLMVPIVIRTAEEMLKLVPNELREAAYALGVPKWRTITKVVIPTSIAGIVTGVTIGVSRVIGETAPLLVIVGLSDSVNLNPFDGRMATLPVFAYFSYKQPGVPPEFGQERAWGAALVLIVIVLLLNLVARLVSYFFSPKTGR